MAILLPKLQQTCSLCLEIHTGTTTMCKTCSRPRRNLEALLSSPGSLISLLKGQISEALLSLSSLTSRLLTSP